MAPVESKMIHDSPLRIAILAPLFYTIPPAKYGGTERVVAYLIQELTELGHDVTLFGLSGCKTQAKLVEFPTGPLDQHLPPGPLMIEYMKKPYTLQLEMVMKDMDKFDVIHVHQGVLPFQPDAVRSFGFGPYLWTDHTELDTENKGDTLARLKEACGAGVNSISNTQRSILTGADFFLGTVYNGIPKDLLSVPENPKLDYLAFLGRISPEKGAAEAARIARKAGMHLRIKAKVEDIHKGYNETQVQPVLKECNFVSEPEITDEQKSEFLGNAFAFLFPIQWEEPFGLVMIEAMACGTPVIAFDRGAVSEVIEHGVTGFVVKTEEEAAAMVKRVPELDRKKIRQEFEERFTGRAMADAYVDIYRKIQAGTQWEDVAKRDDTPLLGSDDKHVEDRQSQAPDVQNGLPTPVHW